MPVYIKDNTGTLIGRDRQAGQRITRLDILNYISHGITKTPTAAPGHPVPADASIGGEAAPAPLPADALRAYCVNNV